MIRLILGLGLALVFGLVAWLPHAAAQDDTYTVSISALNCPTEEDAVDWSPANPDSACDQALGVTFTVADASSGADYGSCVSDWMPPSMGIGCSVEVPVGAEASVTEDTSALSAGYLPVVNPIVTALPAEGGPARASFINVLQAQDVPPAQVPEQYDLPIQVINCPDEPSGDGFIEFVGQGLCEPGAGLSFTVTDLNTGEVYGSCESVEVGLYAQCTVAVPVGSTVTVTEDTVPEGYTLWDAAGWIDILEAPIQAGEGPYAGMVNVLQQNDTYSLPISVINCPTMPGPDEFPFESWEHPCEPATGIRFVAQVGTEEVGSCVTDVFDAPEPQSAAHCSIQVPYGATVAVVEDVSTVPEGYIAVDPPVVVVETPAGPGGDQPFAQFINVQGTPIGGEPAPPSDTGAPTPQLPNTGAGPTLKQLVSIFR